MKAGEIMSEFKFCKNCGAPLVEGAKFCGNCGAPIQQDEPIKEDITVCPNCGAPVKDDMVFCEECGERIDRDTSNTEEVPEQEDDASRNSQPQHQVEQREQRQGNGSRVRTRVGQYIKPSTWIYDKGGWLDNKSIVKRRMKVIYDNTGIRPFLIIRDDGEEGLDSSSGAIDSYLEHTYNSMYNDERHIIILFLMSPADEYQYYVYAGTEAVNLLDSSMISNLLKVICSGLQLT